MCYVTRWISPSCRHHWLTIFSPCTGPSGGFNSCPQTTSKRVRVDLTIASCRAPPRSCPVCHMKGQYDGNQIRMIKDMEYELRFAASPVQHGQMGICCSVM